MQETELKLLRDRQQITEVIYTYCRALDRMDRAQALSIWTEDGEVDYGAIYKGAAAGLIEMVWQIHGTMETHSHQVTNILIEIDSDTAVSEAYFHAALRQTTNGAVTQINARGRYLDRWKRTKDGWRIALRVVASDFTDIAEVTPAPFAANGRRDRDDPSYLFLSR